MITQQHQTVITRDAANKLRVVRDFDGSLEHVWKAWTDSALLDQWWAPRPWKAVTKSMDFTVGGKWLYAMVGPDASKQWCMVDFKTIIPKTSFTVSNGFCDEQGNVDPSFPMMLWKNDFSETDSGTRVTVEITFDSVADLEKIIEMGFKEGFTAAHGNLDELLAKGV